MSTLAPARRRFVVLLSALALAVPLMGVGTSAHAAESLAWTERYSGLDAPTQITSAGDGSGRLFVVEKGGTVRVITRGGRLLDRPFLDISARVRDDGEAGLLSIAFSPRYRSQPYIFVTYTTLGNDVRLARFRAKSSTANRVPAASGRALLTVPHPVGFGNHYAGQLAFDRHRNLFMTTGDGGGGGDPFNVAQRKSSLQGKLLRLEVLGAKETCGERYCIPRGNPFRGAKSGRGGIWATGLRNAWRFSVDRETGDVWIADVGQGGWEEVNRLGENQAGRNLGWSCLEGFADYEGDHCRNVNYHEPVAAYGRDFGGSITGGFVYRGSRFAGTLGGVYVGGDFVSGRVFTLTGGEFDAVASLPMVTSFGEDEARELWAVAITGQVFELTGATG
jgi:glucose/arabinose dehydrogenase